jgi:AGZA family xanthine/uracil permease-like MFS transporter
VESSAGFSEGGKTGLTSLLPAILFIVALIFAPIIASSQLATAPALINVGALMISAVRDLEFEDMTDWFRHHDHHSDAADQLHRKRYRFA